MDNNLSALKKQLADLEDGRYTTDNLKGLIEVCIREIKKTPAILPEWLNRTNNQYFDDTEEMIAELPRIIHEWYNNKSGSVHILVPDAFLARDSMEKLGPSLSECICVEAIYVKADGNMNWEDPLNHMIVLCPGRFQSLQLFEITKNKNSDSNIIALDPDRIENLSESIRKNDISRLEFLAARWEIERQEEYKKARLEELLAQLRAMIGGDDQ